MALLEESLTQQGARALRAAQAQQGQIAAHSEWAEEHGRLHSDVVDELVEVGVGRLYLPTQLGGYALPPAECALVAEALAQADASAAWYVMVFNAARLMASTWPRETVEMLWADNPDCLVAASGHTPMQVVPADGGYVVQGQNSFVSGCHHAKFMMAPALLRASANSDPEPCTVVVPMSECEILPNWDTLGMRGTGSNDVLVPQVRVAKDHVFTPQEAGSNGLYSDALYRAPARVVFATYVPVALKLAEQAIEELSNLAGIKVPYATDKKLAHKSIAQQHFARALAHWRSARTYFYAALDDTWRRALAGDTFSEVDRADLYLAGTHALQTSAIAVRHVMDAAGSSSLRKGSVLERIHRDMETLRHHGFASESRYASVAQVHWGVDLDYPLLLR